METISGPYLTAANVSLLKDRQYKMIADVLLKQAFLTTCYSDNFPKRKGKILIQDNVEMIRCSGICGKYNHSK